MFDPNYVAPTMRETVKLLMDAQSRIFAREEREARYGREDELPVKRGRKAKVKVVKPFNGWD